jgi:hypothetical protein
MEKLTTVKVQKNQVIATQKQAVKKWYIVLEGNIIQRNSYARVVLGKNAVIGISENERYICDYVAGTDSILAVFPYESADDLKLLLKAQPQMRGILLRAAVNQRQMLLKTYAGFQNLVRQFHSFVENQYNDYATFCAQYRLEGESFPRIDNFKPLEMIHKAENWEINNSTSLMQGYLEPYLELMQKDDSLCIGAIMEACYQTRRVTQGIIEMVEYLKYNQDILLSESSNDIFNLYFNLLLQAEKNSYDVRPLTEHMDRMAEAIRKLGIYGGELVTSRINAYESYELSMTAGTRQVEQEQSADANAEEWEESEAEEDGAGEDCLLHILNYSGLEEKDIENICTQIRDYQALPDMLATEGDAYRLRRSLTQVYYDVYYKVFMHAMREPDTLTPIVEMFLNFGFMDVQLAGEENANIMYDLTEHLEVCNSNHIYTIFTWLKSIYEGKNEPSKNEFDLDYPGYLAEQRKTGKLTAEQQKIYMSNLDMKLKFEIQNMFTSGNRSTYGKISTFCPILCEYDLINSVEKMLVTVQKLESALNKIRKIDFSVFYRETMFSDPDKGINSEMIMKEVLPDIILMPNAGTRAMMWQETAGVKRDTSARFLFPIFTAVDVDDMMVETVGRYRWEICRKIQGVHWNDIRDKSLTSEYCDYIQFYKKNHDLSAEAKEKVRLALLRGRNNYREVFVKDYQSWIKFESKGSFRLNKVAREILVVYCPFSKSIREDLKANPMYQSAWHRYDVQAAKKVQRINGVYDKYLKAGGKITPELQENLDYYDL